MLDIMLREFGRYCRDDHRNNLYQRAIEELVRPGDVVVDLGCGFGLLSLMAARAGARRVYAIEQGPYLQLAASIAKDNGLHDQVRFIQGNSMEIELPEKADLLVSETLGQFALEEFTVEYLADARRRFLRPGAEVIPKTIRLCLTPVELPRFRQRQKKESDEIPRTVCGFDVRRLVPAVVCSGLYPYVVIECDPNTDRLLGPTKTVQEYTIGLDTRSHFQRDVTCLIDRPGTLDGFLGTFEVQLTPQIRLSTDPAAPLTHWRQVVFPVQPPREVTAGTTVPIQLGFAPGGRWSYFAADAIIA